MNYKTVSIYGIDLIEDHTHSNGYRYRDYSFMPKEAPMKSSMFPKGHLVAEIEVDNRSDLRISEKFGSSALKLAGGEIWRAGEIIETLKTLVNEETVPRPVPGDKFLDRLEGLNYDRIADTVFARDVKGVKVTSHFFSLRQVGMEIQKRGLRVSLYNIEFQQCSFLLEMKLSDYTFVSIGDFETLAKVLRFARKFDKKNVLSDTVGIYRSIRHDHLSGKVLTEYKFHKTKGWRETRRRGEEDQVVYDVSCSEGNLVAEIGVDAGKRLTVEEDGEVCLYNMESYQTLRADEAFNQTS